MVGLEIMLRLRPDKRHEFLQACELIMRSKKKDWACVNQSLFEKVTGSNHLLWLERWADSDLLHDHLMSERFRTLIGAIEVLGTLEDVKLVELRDIPAKQGERDSTII